MRPEQKIKNFKTSYIWEGLCHFRNALYIFLPDMSVKIKSNTDDTISIDGQEKLAGRG